MIRTFTTHELSETAPTDENHKKEVQDQEKQGLKASVLSNILAYSKALEVSDTTIGKQAVVMN